MGPGSEAAGEVEERLQVVVAGRELDVRGLELVVRRPHLLDRLARAADVLPDREHHRGRRQRECEQAGDADLLVGDRQRQRQRARRRGSTGVSQRKRSCQTSRMFDLVRHAHRQGEQPAVDDHVRRSRGDRGGELRGRRPAARADGVEDEDAGSGCEAELGRVEDSAVQAAATGDEDDEAR